MMSKNARRKLALQTEIQNADIERTPTIEDEGDMIITLAQRAVRIAMQCIRR